MKRTVEDAAPASGTRRRPDPLTAGNWIAPYAFSAPAVFIVGAILAFPVVFGIYQSFFSADALLAPREFVGASNYLELAGDAEFWASIGRSAIFVAGCLVLGQTLAVVFAFNLNRLTKRLRFVRAIAILPYIVSSVALAIMFRQVFNQEFGLPTQILNLVGIEGPRWLLNPTLAMIAVIVAQVWSDLPLSMLIIFGGLQTIDGVYLDAAKVDGATSWQQTRYVSFPLIMPQLAISTVWLSYKCLISLGVILALTGGGPSRATQTLPMEMYEAAFERFDTYLGYAIVVVILGLNGLLTAAYIWTARRFRLEAFGL